MKTRLGLFLAALGLATTLSYGQAALPAQVHQFDFWIGEWTVTTATGKLAGTSRIEPVAGGFGLLENWRGAKGSTGKSLNAYNPATKQWKQFWVGVGGTLELTGGLDARGRMVLTGESSTPKGSVLNRITWTPNNDGTVRQRWEQSADNGTTWETVFNGLYRRKK